MAKQNHFEIYAQKYRIHEETLQYGKMLSENPAPSLRELGVEKSREVAKAMFCSNVSFDGEETEIIIPSPHDKKGIPVSVYKPTSRPEVPAILIYFHGGGLVVCSRKTHEPTLKMLARKSGAIILNVEFRLLPNPNALYAPFDDAEVVIRWVLGNREAVGGKSSSKVGVGGDSSGGLIAVGATNEIRGVDFLTIINPVLGTGMKNETFKEFSQLPLLTTDDILFILENSLYQMPDNLTNPRINALAKTNREFSPPALIFLAELDPFRGDGEDYAEELRAAGVKVQLEVIRGVPHGFLLLPNVFKTTTDKTGDCIATFIKKFQ